MKIRLLPTGSTVLCNLASQKLGFVTFSFGFGLGIFLPQLYYSLSYQKYQFSFLRDILVLILFFSFFLFLFFFLLKILLSYIISDTTAVFPPVSPSPSPTPTPTCTPSVSPQKRAELPGMAYKLHHPNMA